jgi:MerR family transcriptional regulator, repressor of the yfmOP operon
MTDASATARSAGGARPADGSQPGEESGGAGRLLGIGAAATRLGVSERALRYYQQIGLLVPASTTRGGLRRYSENDLARVTRIPELQTLLGLNLDEVAVVLRNEDRMAEIRRAYHDERASEDERQELTRECLALQENLRATVEAKRAALDGLLAGLDTRIKRIRDLLAGHDEAPSLGTRRAVRAVPPKIGPAGRHVVCALDGD